MAYYYQHNFTSPEIIYSIIQEELKSYFDTSAIDNLLFPTYVDRCLRKLGNSSYPIKETLLHLEDFTSRLPDNFHAVREAWLCTEVSSKSVQEPVSFYSQTDDPTTILISAVTTNECASGDCEIPTLIQAVYKTNKNMAVTYRREYLLKPGNISARTSCDVNYTDNWNIYQQPHLDKGNSSIDSFDIRDNKFVTNFRTGIVHLIFYSNEADCQGNQMIPDNFYIRDYIENYIKYKMFETLLNQTNDETFPQLEKKLGYYKQLCDEAYILASTEIKKQTIHQKQTSIRRTLSRFNMYELPTRRR